MHEARMQRTLGGPVALVGHGYWSGERVTVELRPSGAGTGVVFVRSDLGPGARVAADSRNRVDVPRRTNLASGGAEVQMVEHLLAALAGLGVDNCEVLMDRPEAPGMDGSAALFVEAIESIGVVEQDEPAPMFVLEQTVRAEDGEAWVEAAPHPEAGYSVEFRLRYPEGSAIPTQTFAAEISPECFRGEICDARTFVLESVAEQLKSQGLGRHVQTSDLLVFGPDGPIGNTLRYDNECARHKALDVIGDLALSGLDVRARIVANRSGHRLNAELAGRLRELASQKTKTQAA